MNNLIKAETNGVPAHILSGGNKGKDLDHQWSRYLVSSCLDMSSRRPIGLRTLRSKAQRLGYYVDLWQ